MGLQRSKIIRPRPTLLWKRKAGAIKPSSEGQGGSFMPTAASLVGSTGLVNNNIGSS